MYVGGPNTRADFHIEAGEELFFQAKGDAAVVIMEQGRPRRVEIREGEMWILPARIPHSPQRLKDTIGLVVERERLPTEIDGLRYYCGGDDANKVLWEEWTYVHDLGVQLAPIMKRFFASEQYKTGKAIEGDHIEANPPLEVDQVTSPPPPFSINKWLEDHSTELKEGTQTMVKSVEFTVVADGCSTPQTRCSPLNAQTWFWQYRGEGKLVIEGVERSMIENDCILIDKSQSYTVSQPTGGISFTVTQVPA